jgi:hypothetical protein
MLGTSLPKVSDGLPLHPGAALRRSDQLGDERRTLSMRLPSVLTSVKHGGLHVLSVGDLLLPLEYHSAACKRRRAHGSNLLALSSTEVEAKSRSSQSDERCNDGIEEVANFLRG